MKETTFWKQQIPSPWKKKNLVKENSDFKSHLDWKEKGYYSHSVIIKATFGMLMKINISKFYVYIVHAADMNKMIRVDCTNPNN